MINKKFQIGVIGSAGNDDYNGAEGATGQMLILAEKLGRLLAEQNAIVVTGGKSGIMEAAAKGAKSAGGITAGVVKGKKRFTSNSYTDIEIISGMDADGFDEFLLVNMCDGLIVLGGGAGTLEEMAIAYRNKKPMVALTICGGWAKELGGKYLDERNAIKVDVAEKAEEAIEKLIKIINK